MTSPRDEYSERVAARAETLRELERIATRLSSGRAVAFLAFAGAAVTTWAVANAAVASLALVCLIAFIVLVLLHGRNRKARARALSSKRYYEEGLLRLQGKWQGRGVSGEVFLRPEHPYAPDLDLFGEGSVFERLCRARTSAGQARLASWLTKPAEVGEIIERQSAIETLRGDVSLREDLAVLSEATRRVHPTLLVDWAEQPRKLESASLPLLAWGLAVAMVAALIAWPLGLGPIPLMVVAAVEYGVSRRLKARLLTATSAAVEAGTELEVLAGVLRRFEAESFEHGELKALAERLRTDGTLASAQIARLLNRVSWLEAAKNQFFAPIAWGLMWDLHFGIALERWRKVSGQQVRVWLDAVGELEALSSLATYAYENPDDPFPELVADADSVTYEGKALGHPLIPVGDCVRNDVTLGGEHHLWVVSGSNMSGKSTLLRTVGTNAVLAMAGAPVRAESLRMTPFALGATLRIQDDLSTGTSRFYAEIKRLRQIMDLTEQSRPLLFLLDEILHGTNSHDRRIGAEAVVRALADKGAVGLVTTHDLALARTAEELPNALNVHFEDQLVDGRLSFDYSLRDGVVTRSNAIELMRAVGLEV